MVLIVMFLPLVVPMPVVTVSPVDPPDAAGKEYCKRKSRDENYPSHSVLPLKR
jgi:hypothetical protein